MNVPKSCIECPFEKSCNTAKYMPDCRFAPVQTSNSVKEKVSAFFGKIFK